MMQSTNEQLMSAIGFTLDDLNMNRAGTLTEKQAAKIKQTQGCQRTSGLLALLIIVPMLIAVFGYVLFFAPSGPSLRESLQKDPASALIVGVVLLVILGVVGGSFLRSFARTRSLSKGEVKSVTGTLKGKARNYEGMTGYEITVGKVKFHVQENVFLAFRDDAQYTIYYIRNPPINIILSAETADGA